MENDNYLQSITVEEVAERFLKFFKENDHKIKNPAKLVRNKDTLFTVAGMQQFSDYFLGYKTPPFKAYATSQPCLRLNGKHNDLENIGFTNRHNTMFTMLGNFSFGAYEKDRAIQLAWEFLMSLGVDKKYIYVTIHSSDISTKEIWQKYLDEDRICILDSEDNFWRVGDFGLCGPSTEIFYDSLKREKLNQIKVYELLEKGEELLELWNIVFMQYNNTPKGLLPLDKLYIDTGMGLERITSVLNGTFDNFSTNDLMNYKNKLTNLECPEKYINLLADHHRSIKHLLQEGLIPGPSGSGYILRKLIRKCYLCFKKFSFNHPILHLEVENYAEILKKNKAFLEGEELNEEALITLHHSKGLPWELLLKEVNKRSLDIKIVNEMMEKHKNKSKKIQLPIYEHTIICTYKTLEKESIIYNIFTKNLEPVNEFQKGFCYIILKESAFYGEGGGQPGDRGVLIHGGQKIKVLNTTRQYNGDINQYLLIHHCEVNHPIKVLDKIVGKVDKTWRYNHTISHTAMHLLTDLLMKEYKLNICGTSVKNLGGTCDYYGQKLSSDIIEKILQQVNKNISKNVPKLIEEKKCSKVQHVIGASEKNPNSIVRVVTYKGISQQLCGGTHAKSTGDIGVFWIYKHHSIGEQKYRISFHIQSKAMTYLLEQLKNNSTAEKNEVKLLYQYNEPKIRVFQGKKLNKINHKNTELAIFISTFENRIKGQVFNYSEEIINILEALGCKGFAKNNIYSFGHKNINYTNIVQEILSYFNK